MKASRAISRMNNQHLINGTLYSDRDLNLLSKLGKKGSEAGVKLREMISDMDRFGDQLQQLKNSSNE